MGPGQSFCGRPGGEAPRISSDPAVHSTKMRPKNYFLDTFLSVSCIEIERKNSFKWKKIYVQGKYFNLMLGEHLEEHLMVTLKHGRHNELTGFQHNHMPM